MITHQQTGTVALVVRRQESSPILLEAISDDREIHCLEEALKNGDTDPLSVIRRQREESVKEDEEFGDYVERLICQPFLKPDLVQQGLQWFKSKQKIEEFQKNEREATQVIAGYAFNVYQQDRDKTDFLLAGPKARVRIRVFEL